MRHTILFHHPETPEFIRSLLIPPEASAATHVRNLEALGYTVLEVSPPLTRFVPLRSEGRAP